jgi:hypothetical protein
MLKPEPPDGALPLLEAFLQFGDPDAAKLVRERPSRLWLLDQDGPVAEAKDAFLDRLRHGQLVAWARHPGEFGGRRWFLVRAADWAQIKVADWQCGSLVRVIEPSRWQRSRRVQRVTVGWDARVAEYTVEPRTEPLERKGPGGAPPKPYKNDVIEKPSNGSRMKASNHRRRWYAISRSLSPNSILMAVRLTAR